MSWNRLKNLAMPFLPEQNLGRLCYESNIDSAIVTGSEGSRSKVLSIAKLYSFTLSCVRTLLNSIHLLQILQLSITGFCLSINTINMFHKGRQLNEKL